MSIFIRFECTSFNIYPRFMYLCQYLSVIHVLLSILSAFHALLSVFIRFSCSCQNCVALCFPNHRLRASVNKSAFACSWPWL